MANIDFGPRRLGHVNLWVSDLEQSIRFYERLCGIELVRRERDIRIGFHSNGNTHHDVGLVEISKGVDRVGRDGQVQIAASRGTVVGLNHLGWEMENEARLVEAHQRAAGTDQKLYRTVDHLISHSIYVADPDGNNHEFYADAIRDWRQIYNLDREDEVSGAWDPSKAVPTRTPNYTVDPPIRIVAEAPLHPSHLAGATFATRQFDAMCEFFVQTAGLTPAADHDGDYRSTDFSGTAGRIDLRLQEVERDERTGLRSFSFALTQEVDWPALAECCEKFQVHSPRRLQEAGRDGAVVTDPDGFEMEFYRP